MDIFRTINVEEVLLLVTLSSPQEQPESNDKETYGTEACSDCKGKLAIL